MESLFELMGLPEVPLLPFQIHSITSENAAISIQPKVGSLRDRVLKALQTPMTDEQLCDALGLSPNTVRPRRCELMDLDLIERCGTALTKSGRSAVLWKAK